MRHALSKHGGNLGTSGSVAFQFTRTGEFVFDTSADAGLEEKILDAALEAGADDVQNEPGRSVVLCAPDVFVAVGDALKAAGLKPVEAEIVMRPGNRVAVTGDAEETLLDLLDWLEALDDVQDVYHNAALG